MADLSDGAAMEARPPDPAPIDAQKDGFINAEDKEQMLDISKELAQDVDETSSFGINKGCEDENGNSINEEASTESKTKPDHSEAVVSDQDKVLKKPDKILPCPRCNSLNTKFCYYNNYNVNQPRHFCKNCQRYWTAGGTMRNLPVGAGRRKTKSSLQQQQFHPCIESAPMRPPAGSEVVMKLGPETGLCKSMTSVLTLEGQKGNPEAFSVSGGENYKTPTSPSSANRVENDLSVLTKVEDNKNQTSSSSCGPSPYPMHPLQGFPGPPWPYSWIPAWNNVAPTDAASRPPMWVPPLILPAPPFFAPPVPFPVMPASFWPCMPSWPNPAWSVPWSGSADNGLPQTVYPATNGVLSGNDSPTLGKHSRDGSPQGEEKPEKLLWVPKTLRIDDPEEAAKSSIWSTLGIRPDESIKRGSLFRGFQSNNEGNGYASNAAQAMHSNPAALARSQAFQENADS